MMAFFQVDHGRHTAQACQCDQSVFAKLLYHHYGAWHALVIVAGHIDLSVGSVIGFIGALGSGDDGEPWEWSMLVT
jgi:ABC-type xylose transport system permease subunit